MSDVERGLTDHQHDPATLLQADVRSAHEEIVTERIGESADAPNRARRHDHSQGQKRPAGNRRCYVLVVIEAVGELLYVTLRVLRFHLQRQLGARTQDHVSLEIGPLPQYFQKPDRIYSAACAADSDDDALFRWSQSEDLPVAQNANPSAPNLTVYVIYQIPCCDSTIKLRP